MNIKDSEFYSKEELDRREKIKNFLGKISIALSFLALFYIAPMPFHHIPSANASSLYQQRLDAEAKQRANARYIQQLSSNYEYVSGELANVLISLQNLTNNEIPNANAKLASAEEKLHETSVKSASIGARLRAAQKDKKNAEKSLKSAMTNYDSAHTMFTALTRKNFHGSQSDSNVLQVIFDAENSRDFIQSAQIDASVSKNQARLANQYADEIGVSKNKSARLSAINKKITSLKRQADANEAAAKKAEAIAANQKSKAISLKKKQTSLRATYESQKNTIAAQKRQAMAAKESLRQQLANIAAKERAQGGGSSSPMGRGMFRYPSAVTSVISPFGWRCIDLTGCTLHTGTDFPAGCGTPIFAAAAGTVTHAQANWYEGGNMQVVVNHGLHAGTSWFTTYNHMSRFAVGYGQYVNQGQVVGYVGSTGWSTGCHLHFEVLKNGQYIDPMSVL